MKIENVLNVVVNIYIVTQECPMLISEEINIRVKIVGMSGAIFMTNHWDIFFKEYLILFSKKEQKEMLDGIFGDAE